MTQLNVIRDRLLERREVDNFWAIDNRITTRLGAHIFTLRKELNNGWEIKTERLPDKNTVYRLVRTVPIYTTPATSANPLHLP